MKAVILAAGKGTRLRPLTDHCPKSLVRVGEYTILEHTLRSLPDAITEVVLVVGYLREQIEEFFGDRWERFKITYVQDSTINGTGAALMEAQDAVGGEDRFLVLMADDLYAKEDLELLIEEPWAMLSYKVDDPSRFGVLQVSENDCLTGVVEKPETFVGNLINTGAYMIGPKYFNAGMVALENGEYGLPQTLLRMVEEKKIEIKIQRATFWFPIAYPEDVDKACALLK